MWCGHSDLVIPWASFGLFVGLLEEALEWGKRPGVQVCLPAGLVCRLVVERPERP